MAATTFLLGGGWDDQALRRHYGELLDAAATRQPTVACVVLDEGDGAAQSERYAAALRAAGPCDPAPVLVPLGGRLDVAALCGADCLLVCGGLTPEYAAALSPSRDALRTWLADGDRRPYAGFSAGSAVAARRALVGGWRVGAVQVCPQEAGEDLDEVTVVDGLGLVPFTVEVHCAQWGTLPRAVAAAGSGVPVVALDENTMLTTRGGTTTVSGLGHARLVTSTAAGVEVRTLVAGDRLPPLH